jgi:hypothetical protein
MIISKETKRSTKEGIISDPEKARATYERFKSTGEDSDLALEFCAAYEQFQKSSNTKKIKLKPIQSKEVDKQKIRIVNKDDTKQTFEMAAKEFFIMKAAVRRGKERRQAEAICKEEIAIMTELSPEDREKYIKNWEITKEKLSRYKKERPESVGKSRACRYFNKAGVDN